MRDATGYAPHAALPSPIEGTPSETYGTDLLNLRKLPVSRLSLKIAAPVMLFAALTIALAYAVGLSVAPVAAVSWVLLIGLFTYGIAQYILARRIRSAHRILREIRRHQFDHVKASYLPSGDELNMLLWQVYRTGQTVENEMNEFKRMENYRREFLGNVSHELKTPIFTIQGFAETLLDGALDDERVNRSFLEKILRSTSRLNALTRDLAEISRLETGEFHLNPEPFSLKRLAREITESLELAARVREMTLRYEVPDELPLVVGDRERIRQVLINLSENAIKYGNTAGRVEIAARALPSGEVHISVSDNGIGIAPQDIPRLTERFYRVDKSRSREQGGTGLGLAIVKHILVAHHCSLHIESKLGQGSSFSFTLPGAAHS